MRNIKQQHYRCLVVLGTLLLGELLLNKHNPAFCIVRLMQNINSTIPLSSKVKSKFEPKALAHSFGMSNFSDFDFWFTKNFWP